MSTFACHFGKLCGVDRPATYFLSKICWLVLSLACTVGKILCSAWHIYPAFSLILEMLHTTGLIHHALVGSNGCVASTF
ncbi:MAG: hypothetical protein ACRC2R_13415 [Xenococcaceae cyanobacterium]